jgi:urate oxidase
MRLGANNYGKAETRLVRLRRDGAHHDIVDVNVSVALAGDLAETHLVGDNAKVLPTDTQKNTVYAFARSHGVDQIEPFGLALARHFVDTQPPIERARVSIEEYGWRRLGPHSFARTGEGVRTATVTYDGRRAWVVSGMSDLVLLNSTGSEFAGFIRDGYTTLADARDRILATAVRASWRHASDEADWSASHSGALAALVDAFAVLDARPEIVEVRFSLPNRHHFLVDLEPFGLDNPGEVYLAADRPYGLIEGAVLRDDAPDAGLAWDLSAP